MSASVSFDPVPPRANLSVALIASLVTQIESGALAPGQQLPTEHEIIAAAGVSRSVVREALASLRARGLIVTRRGSALSSPNSRPRRSPFAPRKWPRSTTC